MHFNGVVLCLVFFVVVVVAVVVDVLVVVVVVLVSIVIVEVRMPGITQSLRKRANRGDCEALSQPLYTDFACVVFLFLLGEFFCSIRSQFRILFRRIVVLIVPLAMCFARRICC